MPAVRAVRALLALLVLCLPLRPTPAGDGAIAAPCPGRYADALSAMSAAAREREARPTADWVHCLRATAVYEQLSYGKGGRVRRLYHRKVRHGTGFAYRKDGERWLVVTNLHVTEFPEVTGEGASLDGVPAGSRKVREELRIVASEAEPDGPDLPLLVPVVTDARRDLAVFASARPLRVIPYAIGRSADLRVGDAVLARGYPLGAFPAVNTGRVIGVGQRDNERGWDHEDFAVDALLNLGSSGSPVLAVSCRTGEPELVGVYHAGYRGAQGLNVVIAIDELRGVLDRLRGDPAARAPAEAAPDPAALRAAVAPGSITFPFGGRAVRVARSGEALRFELLDARFPLSSRVLATVVDAGRGDGAAGAAAELRDALRAQLALVLAYRAAEASPSSAEARQALERLAVRLREREEEQVDLLAAVEAGAPGLAELVSRGRSPAARSGADGVRSPP
ncbi:S1 family peptidase [Anaeromyxobacter oryzisoli]|uniref:S1 family peptidase n=1 Tax=Anaeromyxobacter oryzisoli TaxID=2925408 RepID=UPI001F593755|nr:serine protease [Anaeromyxobacter sp. SG63]